MNMHNEIPHIAKITGSIQK